MHIFLKCKLLCFQLESYSPHHYRIKQVLNKSSALLNVFGETIFP